MKLNDSENPSIVQPKYRLTINQIAINSFLFLSLIFFYLAANGKINNFPTYFLAITVLIYLMMNRGIVRRYFGSSILLLGTLFLTYLASSSFWSLEFSWIGCAKAFGNVLLILGFLIAIMLMPKSNPDLINHLLLALIIAAAISAVFSLYLDYSLHYRPFIEDRISSLGRLSSPVIAALAYGFASIPAMCSATQSTDPVKRVIYLSVVLLLWYTVYLTGSVAVWAGLLLSTIFIVISHRLLNVSSIVLVIAATAFFLIYIASILFRFPPYFFDEIFPRSTSFRPEIWNEAISSTLEHNLWFGFGHLDDGNLNTATRTFGHAHSIFFSSFYYGGVTAVILLIGLIAQTFRTLWEGMKSHDHSMTAVTGLASLIYTCVVLSVDGDRLLEKVGLVWILFWLPVGLAAMIEVSLRRAKSVSPGETINQPDF